MNAVLGEQFGGLAAVAARTMTGALNSGVAAGLQGIKMVLPKKEELPATRIVEALLDNRASDLTSGYMYLDPRPGAARAQNLKNVIVFVVGGGNYVEAHTILDWANQNGVQATYGATDMVSPAGFYDELAALG